jgi:hypothetical protein
MTRTAAVLARQLVEQAAGIFEFGLQLLDLGAL